MRWWILLVVGVLTGCRAMAGEPLLAADDLSFLEKIASDVVEAARVYPDAKVGDKGPNTSGGTLIRPGGRACYPAFWIRDYAMSLDSGLVTPQEQRHALFFTAERQEDEPLQLRSGSLVPVGSIPDHITFDGRAIYYPGTLDDFDGQGGAQWGILPALDDHFYFIHMAYGYAQTVDDFGFLKIAVNGKSLLDRLERAMLVPPSRPGTGIVFTTPETRGVSFGFCDAVVQTGDLLFCSLLKYQAATEMIWLYEKLVEPPDVRRYRKVALALKGSFPKVFALESGLLKSSTGTSAQPDVWGTAFAVYLGALPEEAETKACRALAEAYEKGAIAWKGNIRHVPTTADFSDATAWEKSWAKKNVYQNGAYWGTPVGWVCYAVNKANPELARKLAAEYIAELREGDFRKGAEYGSPWECMHPDNNHRQNPVYMTSVTCPLAAFRRIAASR